MAILGYMNSVTIAWHEVHENVENITQNRAKHTIFTARRLAKRGICRRHVSVCVCVCHTPVLYQNG